MNINDPEIRALFVGIDTSIKHLSEHQTELLARRLAASFVLGTNITREKNLPHPKIDISDMQKAAVKEMTDVNMGYLIEFNRSLGLALREEVKVAIAEGETYADIKKLMKPRIKEVFGRSGQVTIDRVGQTRRIVQLTRDGSLKWIDKPITKTYTSSIDNYADMLSRTVVHDGYIKGRSVGYQASGLEKWRYNCVCDERSRPKHIALHGRVFVYGTEDSEMAEDIMQEPYCRCTATAFFDDPSIDTSQDAFEDEKAGMNLEWSDTKGEWAFAGEPYEKH